MNKTKLSWTVNNIKKMHEEKKVLSFEHPIQRKSEMWTNQQKSLLIHSMLANYPVPTIYVLREDSQELDEKKKPVFNYFVMDGKQRLTSVLAYIGGEFWKCPYACFSGKCRLVFRKVIPTLPLCRGSTAKRGGGMIRGGMFYDL